MTDLSKAELKKHWGTMQKVVSSEPRARQIVDDILLDMETKPRLSDGRGNAMLTSEPLEASVAERIAGGVRQGHHSSACPGVHVGTCTNHVREPQPLRDQS